MDGFIFNPVTLALNSDTAEFLSCNNLQGLGTGVVELRYVDDPQLRAVYSIFVQVERLGSGGAGAVPVQDNWRWCDKCQGIFFGPSVAASSCPSGGTHSAHAQSGSGNYSLPHNAPADASRQSEWRWCDKCQGLYFGPRSRTPVARPEGTTRRHP